MKVTLQDVKAWLEAGAPERQFDMSYFYADYEDKKNWYGTSCCIAGYVYSLVTPFDERLPPGYHKEIAAVAADALGLDRATAYHLFYPPEYHADTKQAAQAVQNVIDYNDPKWEEILEC